MEIGRRQFGRKFQKYAMNIMMKKIIHAKTVVWNLRRDLKRILTKCPLFCVKIGLNAADPIDQRDYFDALADDYTEQIHRLLPCSLRKLDYPENRIYTCNMV